MSWLYSFELTQDLGSHLVIIWHVLLTEKMIVSIFGPFEVCRTVKGEMVVWLFLLWTRATLCMVFLDIFCITLNIQVCECVCFHVCGDMSIWHMFQLSLHHMRELVIDNCDWNETWDLHSPIKNNYEPQGGTDCYCISSLTSNLKPDNK